MQVVAGDLAASEKATCGTSPSARRPANNLQLGTRAAKVFTAAPGTTHVNRPGNAARRVRCRLGFRDRQRRSRRQRQLTLLNKSELG